MATNTKSAKDAPQEEIDREFANITGTKSESQRHDEEYVQEQLAHKAGERIRKLALNIKADTPLRKEIEELAHTLEESVPKLAAKARTEDALITQIEAAVSKAEDFILAEAKREKEAEEKKHRREEHQAGHHHQEEPESADKPPQEKAREKVQALKEEIRQKAEEKPAGTKTATKEEGSTAEAVAEAYTAGVIAGAVVGEKQEAEALHSSNRNLSLEQRSELRLKELRKDAAEKQQAKIAGEQKKQDSKTTKTQSTAKASEAATKAEPGKPRKMSGSVSSPSERRARINTPAGGPPAQRRIPATPGATQTRVPAKPPKYTPPKGQVRIPALSVSSNPLAGKVKMGTINSRIGFMTHYQSETVTDDISVEYDGESDSEQGNTTNSGEGNDRGRRVRGNTRGENAPRLQSSGGSGEAAGGPPRNPNIRRGGLGVPQNPVSNILRGGLGAGKSGFVKAGAQVAVKAAARSPYVWLAVGIILLILLIIFFVIWIIAGDNEQKSRQTCQAPVETMKVTVSGPTEATTGQTLPYQITVTDTVPNQEVTIVATIPQSLSFAPSDITSSWTRFSVFGNIITWKATENLPPNSLNPPNFNFTVTLKAVAPSTNAVLVVDATPARAIAPAAPAAPAPGGAAPAVGRQKSTEELMRIYGGSRADVEAQLVSIDFQGKNVRVHRLVQGVFEKVNAEITAANTGYAFRSVGTYNWRTKNCPGGCPGLSTHSFGITVDINPDTNPYTTADTHDIPPAVVDIFKRNGFIWGGDWRPAKDWMHFEYAGEPGAVAPGTPSTPGGGNCPPAGGGSGGPITADYVPPSADNCGGKYTANMTKNPIGKNFGDPQCNFTKDALHNLLRQEDPQDADFWFHEVVRCESGYNPNAYAGHAEIGTPDPGGAWGLYQMGSSTPPGSPPPAPGRGGQNDRGDVPWVMQTKNAVSKSNQLGGDVAGMRRYWACAR